MWAFVSYWQIILITCVSTMKIRALVFNFYLLDLMANQLINYISNRHVFIRWILFFFSFLATLTAHEVPRPRIESELELQPMAQLQQCQLLNPLHQAEIKPVPPKRQANSLTHCATVGIPIGWILIQLFPLKCSCRNYSI